MDPIIKWPGGKSSEYGYISKFFPTQYSRYIEPFFGGGAVYFKLKPDKAIINDICKDLMDIYRYIANPEERLVFASHLSDYASNWSKIPKYIKVFEYEILGIFDSYKQGVTTDFEEEIGITIESKIDKFNGLFSEAFCVDRENLKRQIVRNLVSKLRRVSILESRHGELSKSDVEKNIETAFRSGFYMHFRDIMNHPGRYRISNHKRVANFYFIREFCYGAMFRFNKDGKFNIPYGGIAYNSKNFSTKVEYAIGNDVHALLSKADIYSADFWGVLSKIALSEEDFVFLDPPYDTDFSDYNDVSFDRKDQERLAKFVCSTSAKVVLVIKNTPFIDSLYRGRGGISIEQFDKSYQYNVRGRNNRTVEHLIIRNFE